MRILAITNAFPKFKEECHGNYIFMQLENLARQGVEIEVVSPTLYLPSFFRYVPNEKVSKYALIPHKIKIEDLNINYPRVLLYNQMYSRWLRKPQLYYKIYRDSIFKFVKKKIREFQPDAIYLTGIFLEGMLGLEIKNIFKVPVLFIENSITRLNDAMSTNGLKKIYREIVEQCNIYICVSKKQSLILKNNGISTEKIRYLPNGFEIEPVKTEKTTSNNFRLITVGFMDNRKGYPMILHALATIKNKYPNIIWTGIGEGKSLTVYKKMASSLGISDCCKFLGRISHTNVIRELCNSDLFVLPSHDESFGIAYLEAMACHLPVIMTKGEGISDFLLDGYDCIMVESNNENQLIELIEKAYNDRIWLSKIADRGFLKSREFSYERNSLELKRIFIEMIKRGA